TAVHREGEGAARSWVQRPVIFVYALVVEHQIADHHVRRVQGHGCGTVQRERAEVRGVVGSGRNGVVEPVGRVHRPGAAGETGPTPGPGGVRGVGRTAGEVVGFGAVGGKGLDCCGRRRGNVHSDRTATTGRTDAGGGATRGVEDGPPRLRGDGDGL